MDNYFAHQWYQKEQKKKEDAHRANTISLINRNLNNLLSRLSNKIDKDVYDDIVSSLEQVLVSSGIWHLQYRNNFENPKVAIAQASLISLITKHEKKKEWMYFEHEAERFMHQLQFVYSNAHYEYRQMVSMNKRNLPENLKEE